MERTTATAGLLDERPLTAASGGEHLLTVVFGLWMTVGLFLDGYFHQNLDGGDSESFVTPWHGVFYAGFVASALWLATMSRRRAPGVAGWRLTNLPPGYGGARLGIGLFALGGAADAAWHSALGVERSIDALLSPSHLMLFVGLVLILSAPLRAAREAPSSPPSPWIVVGSLTSVTALVGFFLNFAWGLGIAALTRVPYDPVSDAGETQVIAGVASMLVTTAVLFSAVRVLLASGRIPVGAFTVLLGVVAALVSLAFDEDAEGVVAALIAGVVLDIAIRLWGQLAHLRTPLLLAGVAALMWLVYVAQLASLDGIEWQSEIWLGAIVLNGLAAYAIATFVPLTAGQRGS